MFSSFTQTIHFVLPTATMIWNPVLNVVWNTYWKSSDHITNLHHDDSGLIGSGGSSNNCTKENPTTYTDEKDWHSSKPTFPICANPKSPNQKNPTTTNRSPYRVLVIGSGLTGSLTCLRIQKRWNEIYNFKNNTNDHHPVPPQPIRPLHLEIAERATYPAGRFGAAAKCTLEFKETSDDEDDHNDDAKHTTKSISIADMGAQVLSTVNAKDERARGGHGITINDITIANDIVNQLIQANLLQEAPNHVLCETEERMIFEGLWKHYFPTKSMKSILWYLLEQANLCPQFGLRIDSITMNPDEIQTEAMEEEDDNVIVKGILRNKMNHSTTFIGKYDCVVICTSAPDVLKMGMAKFLDSTSRFILKHVRYDQRTCEAHFFLAEKIRPFFQNVFRNANQVEINVEEIESDIEFISWQDAKRYPHLKEYFNGDDDDNDKHGPNSILPTDAHPANADILSLVVHGAATDRQYQLSEDVVDKALSQVLGISMDDLKSSRIHKKSIHWLHSQMISPMEAITNDTLIHNKPCLKSKNNKIIVAGDFMTISNFLGCVATADAAAEAVVQNAIK